MTGLSYILKQFNINPENILGIGDTIADAGWLNYASIPAAPANTTEKDPESKKYLSMAKLAIPESAIKILNRSIDILGGYGYMSDQGLEGALRDVRITSIYEGTSKIQKNAIAKMLY